MPVQRLAALLRPPLERAGLTVDEARLLAVTPLVQTRIKTLNDVVDLAGFFFHDTFKPAPAEALVQKNMDAAQTHAAIRAAAERLTALGEWTHGAMEVAMRALSEELGVKHNALFSMLRVATTGQTVATPLFETMEILGRDESLRRIGLAVENLAKLGLEKPDAAS
jgi:glutamyl-tRNA synthetase